MKIEISSTDAMEVVGSLLDQARQSESEGYLFTAKGYAMLASRFVRGIDEPHYNTMTDIVVETLDRLSTKMAEE